MSGIPADLRYGKDHMWARPDPGSHLVRIGITGFAQQSLGDVTDVSLPGPGDTVRAGLARWRDVDGRQRALVRADGDGIRFGHGGCLPHMSRTMSVAGWAQQIST